MWIFVALGAAILLLAHTAPAPFLLDAIAGSRAVWHMPRTDPPTVYLTYDDGPNPTTTPDLLDVLSREHVRATFFLIGANVRRDPATAEKIVEAGHVVGNHSDTHPAGFALEPTPELRAEVDRAERTIHAATGVYPRLFRPPQGIRSPWLMSTVARDSLVTVTWDDAPRDWERLSARTIADRSVAQVHSGSIILLHDGLNLTRSADRSATVAALPSIIRRLRAEGYRFITVPELLHVSPTLPGWH